MINAYDIAYGLGVGLSAPYWLARPATRRKVWRALTHSDGQSSGRDLSKPAVMIHAVSLGEINATRSLVSALRTARPDLQFVITTTTETGMARAKELYGSAADATVVRYPFDFTPAIDRLLSTLRPDVVVLMELEVWPNFMRRCQRLGVPVLLVNGRLTETSFRRYRLIRPLTAGMFGRLRQVCAQDEIYARRFIELGAPPDRVSVTGTMKFDNAQILDAIPGAGVLATDLGLTPGKEPIWVCGSTGPGEEQIVLAEYRNLLNRFPKLRLAIIPRHPERFDQVAEIITAAGYPLIRRSQKDHPASGPTPAVILGDTMGELTKFYSLADVVFVGRTLVDLGPRQHGSDMIEPAALAKPVIVGAYTGNFAEVMRRFEAADAMRIVTAVADLGQTVADLLNDPAKSAAMASRARHVVQHEQGATARHVKVILESLKNGTTDKHR